MPRRTFFNPVANKSQLAEQSLPAISGLCEAERQLRNRYE